MYSGVKLNSINYDVQLKPESSLDSLKFDLTKWFSVKPDLKIVNPLINLPYVIDGDNIITQTNACFTYLGRKLKMLGETDYELSLCEQLLCETMDLRNRMVRFAYNSESNQEAALSLLKEVADKNGPFQKFELWLQREKDQGKSGTFLVGDTASAPDFHLWEMLDQYSFMSSYFNHSLSLLESFPCLNNFKKSFEELPNNKNYFSSKLSTLPFNNKSAKFGATRSGSSWSIDQEYDWGDVSGIY